MKAFVIVMLVLNLLSFHFRGQIVSGKRKRTVLTEGQEKFGLIMTAVIALWAVAILIFGWA